ncbi:MAG: hypothetical protein F4Z06_05825 [Acidimicrobiia bacterium]|nr:hypothetical protein [Acidimicrobiia bacterium]MYE72633.1 hypothetical protein [Acidimicrobiia bacterium]MYJ62687.1 hypothetical protein [Acidimicrobiia bacterium]
MRMASEDRRRQLPWVILGLTVTLTAAIVFALWASSLSNRTAVAVAGRDMPTGSTVQVDDLRAVEMASGQGAGFVPMANLDSVVGRTVRAAIPEGTILHPGLLSSNSPIDGNMAIVGAVLHPGEYPIAQLGPGQPVGVVTVSGQRGQYAAPERGHTNLSSLPGVAVATVRATVAEVSEVLDSGQDALFVSLLVPADDAVHISNSAANRELRLILLPEESPTTDSPPIRQLTVAGAVP